MGAVNLIEEVIGREAFERLCAWVGGGDYSIPADPDSSQAKALGAQIGAVAAEALIAWGAGGRVYVPYLYAVELGRRRAEILSLRERGATIAEIARSYRYTGRYTERQIIALLIAPALDAGEALQDEHPRLF